MVHLYIHFIIIIMIIIILFSRALVGGRFLTISDNDSANVDDGTVYWNFVFYIPLRLMVRHNDVTPFTEL